VPHLVIAVIALVGIASKGHDAAKFPKISHLSPASRANSQDVPAFRTMTITASHGSIHNGIYRATAGAVTGGGARTAIEFAVNGRAPRQRVVYVAGFHVRDVSCDGKPRSDPMAGLVLYNDELRTTAASHGRTLAAYSQDRDETLEIQRAGSRTLTGTFRFGSYTSCRSGGHVRFTATRDGRERATLARSIYRAFG